MSLMGVISFPFAPMLYARDRPEAPLIARLIGTLVYFAIVAPLSWQFGLVGAAAAFVIGYAAMFAVLSAQLSREYVRARRQ